MKIALIRPNYHSHLITPQLGLGYISAYLKEKGFDVKIVDGLNLGLSLEEIVARCQDVDLVGINCLTDYFHEVIGLTKALKKAGKRVVIGGPHATALSELTLKESGADYVVVGEGEITLFELISNLEESKSPDGIPGLISSLTDGFIKRELIKDLDGLPFPDWEQMDPRRYKKAPHGGLVKRFPVAPITSTRGCPYNCSFCASPTLWERQIRCRSPENVVDEVEYLAKNFGIKEVHFEDDNLTLKRSHIENICRLIIERRIDISWATPNGIRVDTITPELLRLMKKSGCYFIAFGIESGNPEILKNVYKQTDLKTITHAVTEAHRIGIMTQGFFIFGLPGETKETIQHTIDYAKRLPLDKAQFLLLDVLPGSRLWDELKDKIRYDWQVRSYQEVTWVPETISRDDLQKAPAKAFRSFFLRPRQVFKLLRYVRLSQIPFILRRIMDFGIIPIKRK